MAKVYAAIDLGEIEVELTASATLTDYGVQGSPVWTEYSDPTIESLVILGKSFPASGISAKLYEHILELAYESACDNEKWSI